MPTVAAALPLTSPTPVTVAVHGSVVSTVMTAPSVLSERTARVSDPNSPVNEFPLTYANIGDAAARGSILADRLPSAMQLVDVRAPYNTRLYFSKKSAPSVPATEQDWDLTAAQVIASSNFAAGTVSGYDYTRNLNIWTSPFGNQTTWVVALTDDIDLAPPQLPTFSGSTPSRVIVRAIVTPGTEPGTVITNRALVSADDLIRAVTNQVRLVVSGAPGLAVERSCGPDVVAGGEAITLTSDYVNNSTNQDLTATFSETIASKASIDHISVVVSDASGTQQSTIDLSSVAGLPLVASASQPVGWNAATHVLTIYRADFGPLWTAHVALTVHLDDVVTSDIAFFESAGTGANGGNMPVSATGSCAILVANPEITSTKLVSSARPVNGDYVTFTVTVTNSGPHAATQLVLDDVLDAGFTYEYGTVRVLTPGWAFESYNGYPAVESLANGRTALHWREDPDYSALINLASPGSFPGNSSVTFQYEARVVEATPNTTFQNCVQASQSEPAFTEDDDTNNNACVPVTTPYPDLYVTKSGAINALGGDVVRYTLAYGNRSRQSATGVLLVDRLPDWAGEGLPPAGPGVPDNKADVVVVGAAGQHGEQFVYSSQALDTPKASLVFSASAANANWIGVQVGAVPGVQSGSPRQVTVDLRLKNPRNDLLPRPGASYVNCASVSSASPDDNPADNGPVCATTVIPGADLAVDKQCGAPCAATSAYDPTCVDTTKRLRPGDTVDVFISAQNSGTDNVYAIRLSDTFPSQLEVQSVASEALLVSASGGAGHAVDVSGATVAGHVLWTADGAGWILGTRGASDPLNYQRIGLPPGTRALLRVTARIKSTTANEQLVLNSAIVSMEQTDARPEDYLLNNQDDCTLHVYRPDLKLAKAVTDALGNQGPVGAGAPLHYTISYNNIGLAAADDVLIADVVPSDTYLVPASFSALPVGVSAHFFDLADQELVVDANSADPDPRIVRFEIRFDGPAPAPMNESFFETADFAGSFYGTSDIGGAVMAASGYSDPRYVTPLIPEDEDQNATSWGLVHINGGGELQPFGTDEVPQPAPSIGSGDVYVTLVDRNGLPIPGYQNAVVHGSGSLDISALSPRDYPQLKVIVGLPAASGGPADSPDPVAFDALGGDGHGEVWLQHEAFAYGLVAAALEGTYGGDGYAQPALALWTSNGAGSWGFEQIQQRAGGDGSDDGPIFPGNVDRIYWGGTRQVVTHDTLLDAVTIWDDSAFSGDWSPQIVRTSDGYQRMTAADGTLQDVAACEYSPMYPDQFPSPCPGWCGTDNGCVLGLVTTDTPTFQASIITTLDGVRALQALMMPAGVPSDASCTVHDINESGIVAGVCAYSDASGSTTSIVVWRPIDGVYGPGIVLASGDASHPIQLGGVERRDSIYGVAYDATAGSEGWYFMNWYPDQSSQSWYAYPVGGPFASASIVPGRQFGTDEPVYKVSVGDGSGNVREGYLNYTTHLASAGQSVGSVDDGAAVGTFGNGGALAVTTNYFGGPADLSNGAGVVALSVLSGTAVTGEQSGSRLLWAANDAAWDASELTFAGDSDALHLWPATGSNDENGTTGSWPADPGHWASNTPIVWNTYQGGGGGPLAASRLPLPAPAESQQRHALGGTPGGEFFGASTSYNGLVPTRWTYTDGDITTSALLADCDARVDGVTPDGTPYGHCDGGAEARPIFWRASNGYVAEPMNPSDSGIHLASIEGWNERVGAITATMQPIELGGTTFSLVEVLFIPDGAGGFTMLPLLPEPIEGVTYPDYYHRPLIEASERKGDLITASVHVQDADGEVYYAATYVPSGAGYALELVDPGTNIYDYRFLNDVFITDDGELVTRSPAGANVYRPDGAGGWSAFSIGSQYLLYEFIGRGASNTPAGTTRLLVLDDPHFAIVEVAGSGDVTSYPLPQTYSPTTQEVDTGRTLIRQGYILGQDYTSQQVLAMSRTTSGYSATPLGTSTDYPLGYLGLNVGFGYNYATGELLLYVNDPDGSTSWHVDRLQAPDGYQFYGSVDDIAHMLSPTGVGVARFYGSEGSRLYALVPGAPATGASEAPSITPGSEYHLELLLDEEEGSYGPAGRYVSGACWLLSDGAYFWGCGSNSAGSTSLDEIQVTYANGDPSFAYDAEVQPTCSDTIENRALISTSTPEITLANNEGVATIPVAHADLSVTLTVNRPVVSDGQPLTWTAVITNNGPSAAESVALAFEFPDGVTPSSPASFSAGTLASGASTTTTFSADFVSAEEGTVLAAQASVFSDDDYDVATDCNPANDTASAVTIAGDFPNLWVLKDCPESAPAGSVVTCAILYGNNGNRDAANVTLTDTLPPGTVVFGTSDTSKVFDAGTVAAGTSDIVYVSYVTTTCGFVGTEITNQVSIVSSPPAPVGDDAPQPPDANAFDNEAADSTLILPSEGRLDVSLFASRGSAEVGDYVTFTADYASLGSQDVANAVVTLALPTNAQLVSSTPGATVGASSLSWSFPVLPAGASGTVAIVVKVLSGPLVQSAAAITGDGICPTDPPSIVDVPVPGAGLQLVKAADHHVVCGADGDTVRWSIVVTNTGVTAIDDIVVSDTVPGGLGVNAGTIAGPGVDATLLPTIRWNVGRLLPGQGLELAFSTQAPTSDGDLVTNRASATYRVAAISGATLSNEVPVRAQCTGIALEKSWDAACHAPGTAITTTLVWTNRTGRHIDLTVTDPAPGFTGISTAGSESGGIITWHVGDVAPGQHGTLTWSGIPTADSGDVVSDTAIASAPGEQPQTSNAVSAVVLTCPDDLNPCTTTSCEPSVGCYQAPTAPIGTTCDDGNACTDSDSCVAGACMGTSKSCDDDNVCTQDSCSPATGCVNTDVGTSYCDDGFDCTADSCDAHEGCQNEPVDTQCNDGNYCTSDTCDPYSSSHTPDAKGCVHDVLATPPSGTVQCGSGACGAVIGTLTCGPNGEQETSCDPALGDVVDTTCSSETSVVYAIVNDKGGQPVGTIRCTRTVGVDATVTDCDRSDDPSDDPLTLKVYDGLMCPGTDSL